MTRLAVKPATTQTVRPAHQQHLQASQAVNDNARRGLVKLTGGGRQRLERLTDIQIEIWPGDDGHRVHLVDPSRFAATLSQFVTHCARKYR